MLACNPSTWVVWTENLEFKVILDYKESLKPFWVMGGLDSNTQGAREMTQRSGALVNNSQPLLGDSQPSVIQTLGIQWPLWPLRTPGMNVGTHIQAGKTLTHKVKPISRILKMQQRVGKTARQVKAPDTKPDHPSSTPGLTWWKERTDAHKLTSDLYIPIMAWQRPKCTAACNKWVTK